MGIHVIISLFQRDLPIFEQISLFGISEFPYISYTSPYLEFQISLFKIKKLLLCLIILPILKSKSPYLASQMDHMYGFMGSSFCCGRAYKCCVGFFLVYHICVSVTYVLSFLINRCDKYRVRKIKMDEMFMIVSTFSQLFVQNFPSRRITVNYLQ